MFRMISSIILLMIIAVASAQDFSCAFADGESKQINNESPQTLSPII